MLDIRNCDNMELMAQYPDKYFDLAIVDPPYGLGKRLIEGGKKGGMGSLRKLADSKVEGWDKIPTEEYFTELKRISKNQIIWGGNYFLDYLGSNDGLIIWDKMNGTNALADAEIAWKSLSGTTRIFRMHHFSTGYDDKIHPTQKPVKLYEWLLHNYAKEGDKILDTHLGSGSIAIACHNMKFDLTACELDKDYFDAAMKRIKNHTNQVRMF
jgi:site-specific DNA-methyltransferase (adenine-specific)